VAPSLMRVCTLFGHPDSPRAAEVRPAESDAELARAINSTYEQGAGKFRECGEFLLKVRAGKSYGEWGKWLEKHVTFSRFKAARLMKAAKQTTADGVTDALSEPFPADDADDETEMCNSAQSATPQSSAPRQNKPPATTSAWTKPAGASSSADRKPTDQEAARLLVGHVPADPDATVPGEKAKGALLAKIVGDALASARKLREDVDLYHAHHGGFPGPDDVRPIVAALEQARKECESTGGTNGC
jgi:hypothetical protein